MVNNRFCIVSAGRTGSNYLGLMLGSHPNITYWGELFNRNDDKIQELLMRHKMLLHPGGDPVEYLDKIFTSPYLPEETEAIGFKLIYTHARTSEWKNVWDYIRTDTKIIHLKRKNALDAFLSYRLAGRENSYVSWQKDEGYSEEPIAVNVSELKAFIKSYRRAARQMDFFLKNSDHMEVFYEDICASPVILEVIQKFIGVEKAPLTPKTYRQRRKPKSEMIVDYRELQAQFRDSQFWEFFDEE